MEAEMRAELVQKEDDYYIRVKYDYGVNIFIRIAEDEANDILSKITPTKEVPARAYFTITEKEIQKLLAKDTKKYLIREPESPF